MIAKNIRELEPKARKIFTELGYSKSGKRAMLIEVRKLIKLHDEQQVESLNSAIIDDYVKWQEKRYHDGEISRGTFLMRKTASEYFVQIHDAGTIVNKRRKLLPPLPDAFECILSDILANETRNPKANIKQCEQISSFFRWLWKHGHENLSRVDERIVREYLTELSLRVSGGSLDNKRRALKELFLSVSENGVLPEQMNRLFMFNVPTEKKIKPFMAQDEIAAVLNIIDKNTVRGKRDYAIILLATVTGLRRCDIADMRLDSIDWHNGEIRILQEKTEKALALPLTSDVGRAIREYILSARPHSEHTQIFLSTRAPFAPLHSATLNSNLKNYRIAAGLIPNRSFHSLRRSIATNMVIAGVPINTVAQMLDHEKIDTTKQYISLDSLNLKECALDFRNIQVGGGGL
jgi:site-specific recombinase XerD